MAIEDKVVQVEGLDAYIYEGKIDIPNVYSAGAVGSRFLTELRDNKKIWGMKCKRCNKVYVPPRSTCKYCFDKLNQWVEVGNKGTVTSYTVDFSNSPVKPDQAPIIYGIIQLDGADTGLVHMIGGVPLEDLKIGMRVQAVFKQDRTAGLLDISHFKPLA